jgi:hypothetical protein
MIGQPLGLADPIEMYEQISGSANNANLVGLAALVSGFISLSMFTQQDWLFREGLGCGNLLL